MADTRDRDSAATGPGGQPGAGGGRVEKVGHSPVYPGSGPYPEGDAEVRTPGSFVHGQVDEQGRPVEGGSEIIMTEEGFVVGVRHASVQQPAPG